MYQKKQVKFNLDIHHSTLSLWLQGKIKGHQVRTEETIEQWLQNLYSNKPRFTKKFSSRFYKLKHGKIVPFIATSTESVKASYFQTPEYIPISIKIDYDNRYIILI